MLKFEPIAILHIYSVWFPHAFVAGAQKQKNRPKNRILREMSSLEPAPNVRKPMSRSKNIDL